MSTNDYAFKQGVLLAETYEKVTPRPDPTGWWLSEKLDGVRAYWNGKNFYSRNGLLFDAPEWFKKGLPSDVHLDGELWCGREQFERCVGIIKYHKGSTAAEWAHLVFLCFDAPSVRGNEALAYEDRHDAIISATTNTKYAAPVGVRKCTGQAHLAELLADVLHSGGEGLMLRQPKSKYVRTRSSSLLKVKAFLDTEARVCGHAPGKNRLQGMLGALVLEMPLSGLTFDCGTGFKDAERNLAGAKRRWPVGTVISYKYQNLTKKGVPRFPVFLRERTDKTWEDVVADAQKDIDDRAAAAAMPSLKRAPSLMAKVPVSDDGKGCDSAVPTLLPVKRASSGPMFTDDKRVEAVAAAAAECPPSRARVAEDAEPRVTRAASVGTVAPAVPTVPGDHGKRKWDVQDGAVGVGAAQWRDALRAKEFHRIKCVVGGKQLPLKKHQLDELEAWAAGKWSKERLHLKAGAPSHLGGSNGKTNSLTLLDKP